MSSGSICQVLAATCSLVSMEPRGAPPAGPSPEAEATEPADLPVSAFAGPPGPDVASGERKTHSPALPHLERIDLSASYGFEIAANARGGRSRQITDASQLVLAATMDAGRTVGLPGGTLQATVTYRHGKDLGSVAGLGTLQQVQEVYGRGSTWRLTQLWYAQSFAGGKADLKLGRLTQGEDFGSFSCRFMNLTFCGMPAGNLAGDYWYNWPISQWGARVRLKSRGVYAMAGAYEANPRNLEKGFSVGHFRGAKGVLVPVEVGYNARRGRAALPGTYKLGAWYSSSDAEDVRVGAARQPFTPAGSSSIRRSGRYGFYLQVEQQLNGVAGGGPERPTSLRGLVAFLNVTQTDRRTSVTDSQVAAGLSYRGLSAARPQDLVAIAVGRTGINKRATSQPRRGAEYTVEMDYGLQAAPWLSLRPNIQYIFDPGGSRSAANVIVIGLRGAVTI